MVASAAAGLLGLLGGHALARPSTVGPGVRPAASRVYVVQPGDTVWSIAARIAGPAGDPRPLVDGLIRTNHIADGVITPGERLRLSQP